MRDKEIMYKNIVKVLVLSSVMSTAQAITQAPPENSGWYYQIGGAQSISVSPNVNNTPTLLNASANWGINYSCGKFNPQLGVSTVLNDVKSGADAFMNNMLSAATSAISSLPALILQRANPGLYDLFQGGLLAAKEQVTLATKNCEQMEAEIAKGINPFDDWATLAVGRDWKVQMGTGGTSSAGTDIMSAKRTVENNAGKNGVDWVGGISGGLGQPPIRMPTDIVKAGYNITMNRAPGASGIPSGTGRVKTIWGSVEAAMNFSDSFVGSQAIRTYEGHVNSITPGKGLLNLIENKKNAIVLLLGAMVANPSTATVTNLEAISAPGTRLSKQTIIALARLTLAEKSIFIDKISEEIAMSQLIEQALLIRRMITMGSNEPNVAHAVKPEKLKPYLDKINIQIETVLFEKRIRKELIGDTVPMLLAMESRRKARGLLVKPSGTNDVNEMNGGAVKP